MSTNEKEHTKAEESRKWYDTLETPLNACSLEVFYNKKSFHNDETTTATESSSSSKTILPLVIGCYQLNEPPKKTEDEGGEEEDEKDANDDESEAKGTRSGELRLYMIDKNSGNNKNNTVGYNDHEKMPMSFGEATQVVHLKDEGILDGKWYQNGCISTSLQQEHCDNDEAVSLPLYAAASSSGQIHLYGLQEQQKEKDDAATYSSCNLEPIASSSTSSEETDDTNALCLALDWNHSIQPTSSTHEIVSSYSDGTLKTHQIQIELNEDGICKANIEETNAWMAHSMFGQPSEVWTTCYASNSKNNNHNLILSGGDDCTMKLWDTRYLTTPICKIGTDEYESGGVTTLAYHPKHGYVFASGSYDEIVRLWDIRYVTSSSKKRVQPLARVNVGGGVWRLKWHPCKDDVLLTASMHGGCRVVNVSGLVCGDDNQDANDETTSSTAACCKAEVLKEFKEHLSMAYGADWIYFPAVPSPNAKEVEVAASCSFYDRRAFLWNPL